MARSMSLPFVYLVLVANLMSVTTCAKVQPASRPSLRVSVFNDAKVPEGQLLQAEKLAARIFAQASVSVEWLNCGRQDETPEEQAACAEFVFPGHLHVRILPRSQTLGLSTFGVSFQEEDGSGAQADVFYEGIARLERLGKTDSAIILGAVIAHELGHLLLGADSHARTGLMRPSWSAADFSPAIAGRLAFTDDQRQSLKARLSSANQLYSKK